MNKYIPVTGRTSPQRATSNVPKPKKKEVLGNCNYTTLSRLSPNDIYIADVRDTSRVI